MSILSQLFKGAITPAVALTQTQAWLVKTGASPEAAAAATNVVSAAAVFVDKAADTGIDVLANDIEAAMDKFLGANPLGLVIDNTAKVGIETVRSLAKGVVDSKLGQYAAGPQV